MKIFKRRIALCLISLLTLCSLCSCGGKKKTVYQSYIQNLLDVNYKGIYTDYIKENGGEESDAKNMHQDCINQLAEQLITHYSLDNAQSVQIKERFFEIAETIYSHTKYSVSESYQENGEYFVDVTVYPVNILNQAYEEVIAYIEQFNSDVDAGVYNNYTMQQYEETFAGGLADILAEHANAIEYLAPVTVTVSIMDDGEYYSISPEDLIRIDSQMIAVETHGDTSGEENTDTVPSDEETAEE